MSVEQTIFCEALAKESPEQRAQYLAHACAGDPVLRARVEELLVAQERAGAFLESPPPGVTLGVGEDLPPPPSPDAPGSTIGHYKLLEQIGEGGMGVVFMAEQTRPVRRKVAVKIIKPGLDTKQVIARFEAERQALALMDHPNIAKVLDAGATEAGRPYFVMELVRGIPITEYCDQHQLDPRQRLELFMQVCQAVQHAHTKGIIHRDLKPNNVLVTLNDGDKPVPKVIDFGIAKATAGQRLTEQTLFTEFRQLIGTPLYMSPEQAEMSALLDVDTRSDVYSLGVLLYELLTGTTPFEKHRLAQAAYDEIRRIIREEEPPRPSTRLSTLGDSLAGVSAQRRTEPKRLGQLVRGELDWIVMRALEKDRSRRYETANGLARDVERYLADQPVEACPPSRTYRMRKFVRRNKAVMTTTAVAAVVLLLATGVSSWQALRATRAERQVAQERDQAVAEKRRADEQTAIAKAVNDFLNEDVLKQASTFWQREVGDQPELDLTVRDALNRAAGRLEGRFEDQPLVLAGIHESIGSAFNALVELEKAEYHLKAALRLRRETVGRATGDDFYTLYNLADVQASKGNYRHALQSVNEALTLAAESPEGDAQQRLIVAEILRASTYSNNDEQGRAEAGLLATLERARGSLGPRHLLTAECMRVLAHVYRRLDRIDEAEPLAREALEVLKSTGGMDYESTLFATESLALIYAGQGAFDEAVPLLQDLVDGWTRLLGPNHRWTLDAATKLKNVYWELGQYRDVAAAYALIVSARPESHLDHYLLAVLHAYADDEAAYRETCAELLRRFGASTDSAILTRTARACLLWPGPAQDRATVMRLADEAYDAAGGGAAFGLTKGMAEYRAGRFEAAAALLRRSSDSYARLIEEEGVAGQSLYACVHATATFYLAMAEHRLGRADVAVEAMDSARTQLKVITPGVGSNVGAVGGVDWLMTHVAAREAETVMRGGDPSPALATTTTATDLVAEKQAQFENLTRGVVRATSKRGPLIDLAMIPDGGVERAIALVVSMPRDELSGLDLLLCGEFLILDEQFETASDVIAWALARGPQKHFAHKSQGWALLRAGHVAEAHAAFKTALKGFDPVRLSPEADVDHWTAAFLLGAIDAQAYADRWRESPWSPLPWFYIGQKAEADGNRDLAIAAYRSGVAVNANARHFSQLSAQWAAYRLRRIIGQDDVSNPRKTSGAE